MLERKQREGNASSDIPVFLCDDSLMTGGRRKCLSIDDEATY